MVMEAPQQLMKLPQHAELGEEPGVELGEGVEPGVELHVELGVELGVEPHEEVGAWLKRVQWIATRTPAHHQPPLAVPPHLPQGPSPSLRLLVAFLLRRRTC